MGTSIEQEATDQMSSNSLDGLKSTLLGKKSQHQNTIHTTYRLRKLNLYIQTKYTFCKELMQATHSQEVHLNGLSLIHI